MGQTERDRAIDVAKGIAIVAIVVGHANRGLSSAGMAIPHVETLDRVLYLCHLTVFAFLSGLFIRRSVGRRGVLPFLSQRTALLVWLYLVWHVIQSCVKLAFGGDVNSAVRPESLWRLWIPEGQLWFLPWLVAATVIVALWAPWRSRARAALLLGASGVVGLATWGGGSGAGLHSRVGAAPTVRDRRDRWTIAVWRVCPGACGVAGRCGWVGGAICRGCTHPGDSADR